MNYDDFIKSKAISKHQFGIDVPRENLNPILFDFQKDIVNWALKKGKAAIFADCGMGKTPMQIEWATHIHLHTAKPVLILAPLAVSFQTCKEAEKFNRSAWVVSDASEVSGGINVTNYDKLHKFDLSVFGGIVLDESSILKSYSGTTRNEIISRSRDIPFKLACTATPAPNDYMELGNHSEFLNSMSRVEMLSMFFIHDSADTAKWRLKGHAQSKYWEWVSSWAVMIRKPSDLGYNDDGFILPEIKIHEHVIKNKKPTGGKLFNLEVKTLADRREARKTSLSDRVQKAVEIIGASKEQWLLWCNLNQEGHELQSLVDGAVNIEGATAPEIKEKTMLGFSAGEVSRIISKPKIAGWGMNWQNCHNIIFVGLSDSYEQYYQAVRRCYRFGQKKEVNVHIIISDIEESVLSNINRKEKEALTMAQEMVKNMTDFTNKELYDNAESKDFTASDLKHVKKDRYEIFNTDCIEVAKGLPDNSIHYSVFSPPFADLYTYSNSDRDMGNSKDYDEFFMHFDFLIKELSRITMDGRLVSFHCMDIPSMKERDGVIGLKDFPGDLIRAFQKHGFIYHSKHTIWKDPLIEATRTKALGLMHKQLMKDSSMCRSGLPDYLITMRKPGENKEPVSHPNGFESFIGENPPTEKGVKFSHLTWQKYASPVWMDIRQTHTLNKQSARDNDDEKHICPLQLDTIERAIELWSNKDDLVFSPFMGIGSEGYVALKTGRRFVGAELKQSYFNVAQRNLNDAATIKQQKLF